MTTEEICKELIIWANWHKDVSKNERSAKFLFDAEKLIYDAYHQPDWKPVLPTAELDWPEHWRQKG